MTTETILAKELIDPTKNVEQLSELQSAYLTELEVPADVLSTMSPPEIQSLSDDIWTRGKELFPESENLQEEIGGILDQDFYDKIKDNLEKSAENSTLETISAERTPCSVEEQDYLKELEVTPTEFKNMPDGDKKVLVEDVRTRLQEVFPKASNEELLKHCDEIYGKEISERLGEVLQEEKNENSPKIENGEPSTIERNPNPEKQYADSERIEKWREDPANEGKLKLGREHDSDVLRSNMKKIIGEDPENSAAHHIVGRDTPIAAAMLEKYGIDRNDPENGIFLPTSESSELCGSIHNGRHCPEYCNEVEERFMNVTSREECLEVLDSIKEDLFKGDLNVNKDNKYNC